MLIDNTLWSGAVADQDDHASATEAIRQFNRTVHADQRVDMVLLSVGGGLTLARKRTITSAKPGTPRAHAIARSPLLRAGTRRRRQSPVGTAVLRWR
jgi:hypothetical protein